MAAAQKKRIVVPKLELRDKTISMQKVLALGACSDGVRGAMRRLNLTGKISRDREFPLGDILPKLTRDQMSWATKAAGVSHDWDRAMVAARRKLTAEKESQGKAEELRKSVAAAKVARNVARNAYNKAEGDLERLEMRFYRFMDELVIPYETLAAEVLKHSDLNEPKSRRTARAAKESAG
jgi:hypothetical protein